MSQHGKESWSSDPKLKILQNRSKTAFETKGRQYTTGEVIQRLFIIE